MDQFDAAKSDEKLRRFRSDGNDLADYHIKRFCCVIHRIGPRVSLFVFCVNIDTLMVL